MPRGDGCAYDTDFFQCKGCTVMFREPSLFAAALDYRSQAPAAQPTMASDVSQLYQSLDWRYWEARATRLNGGIRPANEIIADARSQRYGRIR